MVSSNLFIVHCLPLLFWIYLVILQLGITNEWPNITFKSHNIFKVIGGLHLYACILKTKSCIPKTPLARTNINEMHFHIKNLRIQLFSSWLLLAQQSIAFCPIVVPMFNLVQNSHYEKKLLMKWLMQCTPNIKFPIIWLFKWIVWVGFHICICSLFQIIVDYNVGGFQVGRWPIHSSLYFSHFNGRPTTLVGDPPHLLNSHNFTRLAHGKNWKLATSWTCALKPFTQVFFYTC